MKLLLPALVVVLIAFRTLTSEACDKGLFGSRCQYKCHCDNNKCLDDGTCQDGAPCQLGWFGPGCQYYDLVVVANISTTPYHQRSSVLTDGDDDTCISIVESIIVVWETPYPLSWIRIVGPQYLLEMRFKEASTAAYKRCLQEKIVFTDETLQDVYCITNITVTELEIAWSTNVPVCSLYISGGRNVALKQNSTQSTTYRGVTFAEYAVDGLTTTCSHTDDYDRNPFWTLSFSKAAFINRFVIYNRGDYQYRLQGFSIDVYNKNSTHIFKFTNKDPSVESVYHVPFTKPYEPVSQVKISIPTEYLTLCEVEIYGDSLCPPGWYGTECNKKCQCSDPDEACLVMTGGCSSKCANGYYGDSCDQECLPGYWGVNCLQKCENLCFGESCDRISGQCLQGCIENNNSPECIILSCEKGWFGGNCQYKCHCTDQACDENGLCRNDSYCELGWFGPACQYQDLNQNSHLSTPRHNIFLVSDGDDESCVLNLASIVMEWTTPIPFTWLRLIVLEPDYYEHVTLQFKDSSTTDNVLNCSNPRKDLIDKRTTDFYCDIYVGISQLTIHLNEKRSVCSVYVSGGRNVALRQHASQSSTYSKMVYNLVRALNAVDGSTLSSFSSGSCSRTDDGDDYPHWMVSFQRSQVVNRFVIYNNYEINDTQCCPGGLREFQLSSSGTGELYEFNSTDVAIKHQQMVYNIVLPSIIQYPIEFVTIDTPLTDAFHTFERFVALCEVEIYGDSVCPFGKYGRECKGTCRCAEESETCFVTTGGCQSGCAPGYHGEGCAIDCPEGTWGIDCREQCSTNCPICNVTNGDCYMQV